MKKIEHKINRKIYVTANYNQYADEFDFGIQTWEPGETSDSFVIEAIPFKYEVTTTRDKLVAQQLGKLDKEEIKEREDFNTEMMRIKELRDKLLALTYEPTEEDEENVMVVDGLDPLGALDDEEVAAALLGDLGPDPVEDDDNNDIPF